MRRPCLAVLVASCVLAGGGSTAAQGLADVARATEAARKASPDKPAGKVYTNQDLPASDRPRPDPPAAEATETNRPSAADAVPAPEPTSTPAHVADTPPADRGETYWRERMRPLRERLERDRAAAEDARQRADALMRSADRCFQLGIVCADYTESLRLAEQSRAMLAEVARDEAAIAALEDEARRAGVPPGWLRR